MFILIHLKTRVYLDNNVRIVAAREGLVEIGFDSEIGGNTIINSGGTTKVGEFCMIAGNHNINSSSHGMKRDSYMRGLGHTHDFIEIDDDVWIGYGASNTNEFKYSSGCCNFHKFISQREYS